jgi:hypothetical protein
MLFPQTWRQLCDPGSGVLRDPLGGCPNRARPVLCGGSAVNARPDVALRNGRMIKPGKCVLIHCSMATRLIEHW